MKLDRSVDDGYYVLSLGAGVNSTALLLWLRDNNQPLNEVIFADTGTELPETYQILNVIARYCKDSDILFSKVSFGNLEVYCKSRSIIPSRNFRWCTHKFKKRPIYKHLPDKQIKCYMGIASDEAERAKPTNHTRIKNVYPLVENNVSRIGCVNILKNHGWPIPVKSGCFFCPFQSRRGWQHLYQNHPELYRRAEDLELNNSNYPKFIFLDKPLERLKSGFGDGSSKLTDYNYPPACDSGFCMV